MKKAILLLPIFLLSSCTIGSEVDGVTLKITANHISSMPVKEMKTFKVEGHTFIYYNVYNDGNGNFVMADNSSFISNNSIQFGLRVKSMWVYEINRNGDSKDTPIQYKYLDEDGYYSYSIESFGFEIYGVSKSISLEYKDINVGKIYHWC